MTAEEETKAPDSEKPMISPIYMPKSSTQMKSAVHRKERFDVSIPKSALAIGKLATEGEEEGREEGERSDGNT